MLMEEQKLIEKHAKAAGVDVKVGWAKFAGGNVMNDALLSNSLQFASGGVGPLVTLWARTKGNLDVKAVSAINSMPLYLNTRNPEREVDQGFHGEGQDRAARGQGVDPGGHAADGRRKGLRRGPAGKARRAHRLAVPPRRAGGAPVRRLRDHRALRLAAVPVPAAGEARHPHGAEFLRRARRAGDVQRGVDDVEVPQRESRSSTTPSSRRSTRPPPSSTRTRRPRPRRTCGSRRTRTRSPTFWRC